MKPEKLGNKSTRRGRKCPLCTLVVKPGEWGIFHGVTALHMDCLDELVSDFHEDQGMDERRLGRATVPFVQKKRTIDEEFDEYKAQLLNALGEGNE